MPVRDQDITDLLNSTHPAYWKKGKFTDISQDYQSFIVMPYLLTKNGGLKVMRDGLGVEHTLMVNYGGRSRFVGEYDEDVITVMDHLKKMKVFFSLLTDNIAYTRSEILENRGKSRIDNLFLPRKRSLFLRVAHTMEENFFATPDADDDLTPWGLKYWIVKNATAGFNGGYPTGFTRIGNINLTDVPSFKNYTDKYTAVTKADLIKKMKRAHRRTKWVTPKPMKGFEGDTSERRLILTNEDVVAAFEDIGEAQNENLGKDMAPMAAGTNPFRGTGMRMTADGDIVFKKKPVVHCELLDDDTSDPVYGTDMATFHAMTFKGDNMRLGDFVNMAAGKQHRVFAAHLDHKHQTICTNRRNNWVISK